MHIQNITSKGSNSYLSGVEAKICGKIPFFSDKEVYKIHNSILDIPIENWTTCIIKQSVKARQTDTFKKFGIDTQEVRKELDQLEKSSDC